MNHPILTLLDSDTNETVSPEDLGITDAQYDAAIDESFACSESQQGHIRVNGRRVYAQSY
jgi:hypothetical protein